ncbi:hypothetical protein EMEDMD4_180076 [Sinorhizobium medicae]|uniref:Uncharacterized protein n=1 Tax=Sinorhizobium medicae TaxID=110321 RepID=A0A508WT15_9HYPH|nr:hypothetical protein EMEDMD4_180076 [Sinorhizobium medicae]
MNKLRPDIPCELTAALPPRRFLLLSLIVKDDSRSTRESAEGGYGSCDTMPSDRVPHGSLIGNGLGINCAAIQSIAAALIHPRGGTALQAFGIALRDPAAGEDR